MAALPHAIAKSPAQRRSLANLMLLTRSQMPACLWGVALLRFRGRDARSSQA